LKHGIVLLLALYPGIVYALHGVVPAAAFAGVVLVLLLARLLLSNETSETLWRYPLLFVLCGVAVLTVLNVDLAERAYPALMSLGFAALFGLTLVRPPTLIERFARRGDPSLSEEAVEYCRRVTVVWFVYCLVNAAIASGTALLGSLELWSLWTGVLSYVGMSILFFGEVLLRKRLRRARA